MVEKGSRKRWLTLARHGGSFLLEIRCQIQRRWLREWRGMVVTRSWPRISGGDLLLVARIWI